MAPPRSTRASRSRPSRRRVALRRRWQPASSRSSSASRSGSARRLRRGGERGGRRRRDHDRAEAAADAARSSSRRASPATRCPSGSAVVRNDRPAQAQGHAEALRRQVRRRVEGREARRRSSAATRRESRASSSRRRTSSPRRRRRSGSSPTSSTSFDAELGEGRPARRAVEEPDAVRRPDHRLDGREGDDRARGARQGRRRDLQPAARRGCRSGSTRRSATGSTCPAPRRSRVSQLESDNPYNTRNRTGLPPTPIANPGLASMQAAANPANVDYLFFVRKPDKIHHFFTASESEFFAKACEYGFGCG